MNIVASGLSGTIVGAVSGARDLASVMLVSTTTTVPVPTTAPAGAATTVLPEGSPTVTLGEFLSSVWSALTHNGYQTGVAAIVATVAIVAMVNVGTNRVVTVITAIGAFWAGWLGWNTVTGERTALFPGDIAATKLWDIAFASPTGFMVVALVACVTAVFLWRSRVGLPSRLLLLVGAVLGTSFVYNVFEAFRSSTGT